MSDAHVAGDGSEYVTPAWTPGAYSALFGESEESVEAEGIPAPEVEAEAEPEYAPTPEIVPVYQPVLDAAPAVVFEPEPQPEPEPIALQVPPAPAAAMVDDVAAVDIVDLGAPAPKPEPVAPPPAPAPMPEPVTPLAAPAPKPEPVTPLAAPTPKPEPVAPLPVVLEAATPSYIPPDLAQEPISPPPLMRPPPPKVAPAGQALPPPVRPSRTPPLVQPSPTAAVPLPPPVRPVRGPEQLASGAMRPLPTPVTPLATTATAPPPAPRVAVAPPSSLAPQRAAPAGSRLEVVNKEGWHKEYLLERTLIYAGSQPGSDVYLPVPEVAPRHIQFVPSPVNREGYRLINFSTTPLTLRASGGTVRAVPPRGTAELADGDAVELAGYTMLFHGGEMQSAAIQARVELPSTLLEIDKPIEGTLYIRNCGDKAGVQFEIQTQGYDQRLVQVDSGPVLFPGVEKPIAFRIAHPRRPAPPAGDHTLTLVVTAPSVYPGESAVVRATFTIAPFFAHTVRFISVAPSMEGYTLR